MNQKQILPLAIGVTLGSSLGVIYGVVFENIAIGISLELLLLNQLVLH
jgi:hypothetical protein